MPGMLIRIRIEERDFNPGDLISVDFFVLFLGQGFPATPHSARNLERSSDNSHRCGTRLLHRHHSRKPSSE